MPVISIKYDMHDVHEVHDWQAFGSQLALSLSSFDHDGLGRYGDRLHPMGDLLAMRSAWRSLRTGGLLLLTVPIGPDVIVWNLLRRYGSVRLPMLLRGWEELRRFGWEHERLLSPASWRRSYEPLFLLRRNGSEVDDIWSSIPDTAVHAQACNGDSAPSMPA